MCHALPVRVEELRPGDMAVVALSGIRKEVSVALVDDLKVGDYVVLHVGYALSKIDEAEAARTLDLLRAEGADVLAEFAAGASAEARA